MWQGVWSILKPVSHSCYLRCICPVSINHTEGYWIRSPNSGKPQDDIKAGESCYRHERVCTYKNTHTLYPYLSGEIKATQAVRNHRMTELIKRELVIEATKRTKKQRVKGSKREQEESSTTEKRQDNIHLWPRIKVGHYAHDAYTTKYVSGEEWDNMGLLLWANHSLFWWHQMYSWIQTRKYDLQREEKTLQKRVPPLNQNLTEFSPEIITLELQFLQQYFRSQVRSTFPVPEIRH